MVSIWFEYKHSPKRVLTVNKMTKITCACHFLFSLAGIKNKKCRPTKNNINIHKIFKLPSNFKPIKILTQHVITRKINALFTHFLFFSLKKVE